MEKIVFTILSVGLALSFVLMFIISKNERAVTEPDKPFGVKEFREGFGRSDWATFVVFLAFTITAVIAWVVDLAA
ncbi:hypothetical protein [Jonesia quinghaiensis]|uniref:hypothetical protein n=1 Tax=Jonesia quinghaiensis TaxID=262806 RepID=UPI000414AE40|nr:hypothetical protein [Jonesia quinghaiensis]